MLTARHFLISGRVQGVGFRYFVQACAEREGLGGWVRNLADGRVEAVAEGDRAAVDRLERQIRRGPPGARVEHVEVTDDRSSGAGGFHIWPSA